MDGPDDHFADIAVGRYVYDNLTELDLQIDKTMDHYFNPDTVANWAQNSLLIAHQEDYPGKYTQCCEEIRTFSYAKQTPVFTTAYGGAGATNTDVVNFVNNNACGIFNYRGHGSATELWDWGSSGSFTITHVQQLTNANRLFVFFDVCCDNMDIGAHSGNCLCESFMKSPVASVAVNGAIIPSYTIPNHDYDKEMYKAVFNQGISNIGYVTNYANITVLNVHGTIGRSNVRTYLWLGDPSLEPWTKKPIELTVDHTPQLFLGLSEFPVSVSDNAGPVESALVCVANNDGTIYGRGYTNASGEVAITFAEPVNAPGAVMVTVTKFNHKPYLNTITAIPQSGPYVIKDVYQINDPTGNNNQQLDYGETATVTLTMKNVGVTMANNVNVIIRSSDPYITITDSTADFGNIDSNAFVTVDNAFALSALQSIPDNHNIRINVEATDGDSVWNSAFYIKANAPVLEIGNIAITNDNNANNRLDPGETGDVVLKIINKGHADCKNSVAIMMGNSPYFTITENSIDIDTIGFGDTATVTFNVAAHIATTNGHTVNLDFTVFEIDSVFDTKELIIGIPPEKPIGNGTLASNQYPFYTYYENNKTQIIYLGSEIGAGPQTIKEIAFDFNQLGTTITALTNLTIKFKKTTLAQFGSAFTDMTGATTVFTATSYPMPAANGWCIFNISDYNFIGPDTNLIVEIVWGDNGAWSNTYYKVNCTDAGATRVVYGYSDTQSPPAYNGNSVNRPNIKLFFLANASGIAHDVPFKVIDGGTMAPLPTANVKIGSLQKSVNSNGITMFNLIEGDYEFTATAPIYNPINNQAFTVANADTVTIQMSSAPLRTIDFMVVDSITSLPISGAVITINANSQTTNASGNATFNLYDGNYTCAVNANDYTGKTAQINVNGNALHTIQLVSNVGIKNITAVEVNIYPNPANDQLFVKASDVIKQLKIVDLQGKTIYEKTYSTKNINLQLSQIDNGTYFIYLQTEKGLYIKKIAVVK